MNTKYEMYDNYKLVNENCKESKEAENKLFPRLRVPRFKSALCI